jgi:hypothetical protein
VRTGTLHAFFRAAKTPRRRASREVREQPERRRDIFVESQAHHPQSPIGAAYSEYIAPDGAWNLLSIGFYKDVAPTALQGERSKCVQGAGPDGAIGWFMDWPSVARDLGGWSWKFSWSLEFGF